MAQIDKPNLHFNTLLYTGNGSANNSITGVGFAPDLVWQKRRDGNNDHVWFDKVRGATKVIQSAGTGAEQTSSSNQDTQSLDSDGFTVGTPSSFGGINANGGTSVAWNWKAGGAGSSNTDGSINTTATSVNTTAGFSISTYTGTGSAATVGHGLGSTPKMMLVKCRSNADTWAGYHVDVGATKYMELDTTAAAQTSTQPWNDTGPTSSVFTVGNWSATNGSGRTYVAFCFAEKQGYSKFGKYIGNGNVSGTFVYTGFSPAFVMTKRSDNTSDWLICDNKRPGYNVINKKLFPNQTQAEDSYDSFDFVSNGFKIRSSGSGHNASGGTFIYMAFAENPIVGTNNVAATAR